MPEDPIPVITGPQEPPAVLAAVAAHGAVLLRAGGWQRDTFAALGDALMSPLAPDGGFPAERDVVDGDPTTTTVTRGTRGMPLHREASYAPGSPDLLTFLCERPADDGGCTTLCDGVALLAALSPETRDAFAAMEIVWESTFTTEEWQRMFATSDPAGAERALREAEPFLRAWESIEVTVTGEGLTAGLRTRCCPPTQFSGVPAFCNSLFMTRPGDDEYHDSRLRVRTAEGSPVPADLLAEADRAARRLTVAVPWQAGDMLVVDNTRFLHGRQAFTDTGRTVMVRMGTVPTEVTL